MAIFYFCLLYIISSVFFDIKNTAYKIYNIKQFVSSSLLSHIVCDNVVFLVKFLVVFLKIFFRHQHYYISVWTRNYSLLQLDANLIEGELYNRLARKKYKDD